jgi:hypothetical protein
VRRDGITRDALIKAKEALIAYAAADANRPGELPCPDLNDDGKVVIADEYVGSNCVSLIGRLPWSTLELPDLRDEDGERLWYALSNDFHSNGAVALNNDTAYRAGNTSLTITGTPPGGNVVAIVFSPGPALVREGAAAVQQRGCIVGVNCDATGKCTTAPASNTPKCNPANYLDIASGEDNADGNTSFVSAEKSATFNDRLLPIYSDDIMWVVERRAGRELAQKLRDHFDAWQTPPAVANTNFVAFNGFYPWAAPLTDPSVTQAGTNGTTNGLAPFSNAAVVWNSGGTTLLGGCSGVNTDLIDCNGALLLGLVSINGRVRNVGTAFVDPPSAANVTVVSGLVLGAPTITWTLVPGSNALDFTYSATLIGFTRVRVRAPTASAWTASSWLTTNNWYQVAQYAVSPGYALTGGGACALPGPPQCVSVNGSAAYAAVVMSGRALPGAAQTPRPIVTPPNAPATQFLEGVNNTPANLTFVRALKSTTFNDLPITVRP